MRSKTYLLISLLFLLIEKDSSAQNYDKWAFTDYIYLVKPTYIFKVESEVTHLGGEADKSLQGLIYKVHESSFTTRTIHYYFEVQEVIYGKDNNIFHLSFSSNEIMEDCELTNDFNYHNDKVFWKGNGRSKVIEVGPHDSDLITCFEMGNTYLIINNGPSLNQSYELINSEADKWLEFVRNKVPEIEKLKLENKEWLEPFCKENHSSLNDSPQSICEGK
jgi:hypothetical protein